MRRFIVATAATALAVTAFASGAAAQESLRVLVHQNPPFIEFMEQFNEQFEADNPDIKVEMGIVNANDLQTSTQTRLMANDVDVIDIFAFHNANKDYMVDVDPPAWQQLIDAGLLMDLTDQPFVANYDPVSIADAGTYNDRVYQINLGRVGFSGIYYNKDLFAENGIEVPTTWSELVAACETLDAAGTPCMTAGGGDGWPIYVGAYGLLGANYPDQEALVEALWTGDVKYTDPEYVELLSRYQVYNRDMMEAGASALPGDGAPGRFASGAVAMFPGGTWYAPAIEANEPAFDWGYMPFPGSDDAAANQSMFGKYDQGWAIAENSSKKEQALRSLEAFSEPETYQTFVDMVGPIPTQPTASLNTKIGEELAPYLDSFQLGFETIWKAPRGMGQYGDPTLVNLFHPFGTFYDPQAAAEAAQADLDSGLDAIR